MTLSTETKLHSKLRHRWSCLPWENHWQRKPWSWRWRSKLHMSIIHCPQMSALATGKSQLKLLILPDFVLFFNDHYQATGISLSTRPHPSLLWRGNCYPVNHPGENLPSVHELRNTSRDPMCVYVRIPLLMCVCVCGSITRLTCCQRSGRINLLLTTFNCR